MTIKFSHSFINETATIAGPYEAGGPISKYFDKVYEDLYFGEKTWEQAEKKLILESVQMVKDKAGVSSCDLLIGGDLLNQIVASNYSMVGDNSFIGIYAACATSTLGLILGTIFVENNLANNVITFTSSHNNGAEKQYRYPVEYGGPKPKTTTFTSTGAASALISKKGEIRVESGTIGKVIDSGLINVFHMGGVMAKAAADTIVNHLKDTSRSIDYYDMVLSGDLGVYGKEILKEYLKKKYDIDLKKYNDTGVMLYDLENQPVYAGASGPACGPLVTYSYIFDMMKKKKLKRVLLVATGALMNPSMVNQKLTIPAIAHAISLEAKI